MPQGDELKAQRLGSATVQADGSFSAKLKPHQGSVLVTIEVERFTYAPATGRTARGLLGLAPLAFDPVDDQLAVARLRIDLPRPAYCALLARLDLWLAAGRVMASSPSAGVSGVLVTAFDRDITQDDQLGTAMTDGAGNFEVFFPGEAFRRLPPLGGILGGLTSLELIGGPDLFFHVRAGAAPLLEEPAGVGRTDPRENSSNCSFNVLTVELPTTVNPGPESGPTAWRAIGDYAIVSPTPGGPTDLDADGLTTTGKKAFHRKIKLKGAVFRRYVNGEPIRYRFLVREWANPHLSSGGPGAPPPPPPGATDPDPAVPSGWQALTAGVSGSYGYVLGYTLSGGTLTVTSLSLPASPNANGWIEVDQRPLGPGESYVPTGELCRFNTSVLVPAGGMTHRKFSVVIQVQTPSVAYQQLPQPLHINNDQVRLSFDLNGLGAGCDPFTRSAAGTIDINATFRVEHPYLNFYRTYVRRHDGVNQQDLSAGETFSPATPLWLDPPAKTGTATRLGYAVEPCSYEAGIIARARLTTGEQDISQTHDDEAFCVR